MKHQISSLSKNMSINKPSSFTKLAKSILLCITAFFMSMQMAFAIDVNRASFEELDAIKGIGVKKAQAIIDERNANGAFKDAADLATRVKGLGDKSVANLMQEGLTINGATAASVPAAKTVKTNKPMSAAVDYSGGQNSVTTQNNSAASTSVNKKDAQLKTKMDTAKSKTKIIIPASQAAPTTAVPAQEKKTKQGLPKTIAAGNANTTTDMNTKATPKAPAEITVKPAKVKEAKEAKEAKMPKEAKEPKIKKTAPAAPATNAATPAP